MRLVILAAANSIHTVRWVNALTRAGLDIHLVSQHEVRGNILKGVKVHYLPYSGVKGYFMNIFALRRVLREIKPEILHVHYATGYGTLGRLANYKPFLLSVYGSDVYNSPDESKLMRYFVRKNLKSATAIASTSICMAKKTNELLNESDREIHITPFGVDTIKFQPINNLTDKDTLTIGTVKTLEDRYGIDILIKGFALFLESKNAIPYSSFKLKIVGEGTQLQNMKKLVFDLGIENNVNFVGSVDHSLVPGE